MAKSFINISIYIYIYIYVYIYAYIRHRRGPVFVEDLAFETFNDPKSINNEARRRGSNMAPNGQLQINGFVVDACPQCFVLRLYVESGMYPIITQLAICVAKFDLRIPSKC